MIVTIMSDPSRERSDVVERLSQATLLMEQSLDVRLIPNGGVKFGYAIRGARDKEDVAAVQGGIINDNSKPRAAGPCVFGGDEDIARLVLTAMKFDPVMRSAATLRFSKNMLKVIEGLLFECSSFDTTGGSPPAAKKEYPTFVMITAVRKKKPLSVFLVKNQSTLQTILL
jgi:predicted fused transcriptional regulator/phosphomethylpyrimidine kinase